MKKLITFAALALLAGCEAAPAGAPTPRADIAKLAPIRGGVMVFADPETGCEYLSLYDKGITPRIELNGTINGGAHVRGCR